MIVLRAKLTESRPLDVVRDSWREITRAAYRAVGMYWVSRYLTGHFDVGAGQKYGYKFRSRQYRERKDRLRSQGRPFTRGGGPVIAGGDQPNVLTGYMRREMTRNVIVRGFPSRATVILIGPAYLHASLGRRKTREINAGTRSNFTAKQPDKAKEITTVTEAERKDLGKRLQEELLKGINAYRAQRVTE